MIESQYYDHDPILKTDYLRNIYLLGSMVAVHGSSDGSRKNYMRRSLNSVDDPNQGYQATLHYESMRNPLYNDYPFIVVTKNGPSRQGLFKGPLLPGKDIVLIVKPDGLTHLQIDKVPSNEDVLKEVVQFIPPIETFERVMGITKKRQYAYSSEFSVCMTAEPSGWCPRAISFLNDYTQDALNDFNKNSSFDYIQNVSTQKSLS